MTYENENNSEQRGENMILACQNINKAFGEKVILRDASFHIEEKEKAAIVGVNGAGKSTLLKIIMKELSADSGEVILARDRSIGYLAQHEAVSTGNTIYEELLEVKRDVFELERRIRSLEHQMKILNGEELSQALELYNRLNTEFEQKNGYACRSEITGVLKGLGFDESEFQKQVDTLSGGQKTRVALGKLLLARPDIILLDEPTNHLDILSKEILEQALRRYTGTVLYVSHDRYFINQTATRILELTGNTLVNYIGNYDYYLEKKEELTKIYAPAAVQKQDPDPLTGEGSGRLTWQQQKEEQARLRKRQNDLKRTEERIHGLETRDGEIDRLMTREDIFTDVAKCIELNNEKAAIAKELDKLYEVWEELAE